VDRQEAHKDCFVIVMEALFEAPLKVKLILCIQLIAGHFFPSLNKITIERFKEE
jgi:hypothetical protein